MSAGGSAFLYHLGRNLLKEGNERRRIADLDKAYYASLETDPTARALHKKVQGYEREYQQWRAEAYELYGRPWRKKTKAKIDAYVMAKNEARRPARVEAERQRKEIEANWEEALKDVPRGDYSNEVLTEDQARFKAALMWIASDE